MAEINVQVNHEADRIDGPCSLEARLRHLFAEQHRLRELLEQTRAELDRVNATVLRTQDDYCTSPEREEEYDQCLEKILGFDPRIDLREIEAAKRNPMPIEALLEELEQIGDR
jgi:hypothetical protein